MWANLIPWEQAGLQVFLWSFLRIMLSQSNGQTVSTVWVQHWKILWLQSVFCCCRCFLGRNWGCEDEIGWKTAHDALEGSQFVTLYQFYQSGSLTEHHRQVSLSCVSPPRDGWCDTFSSVPLCGVSSSSTLEITRDCWQQLYPMHRNKFSHTFFCYYWCK